MSFKIIDVPVKMEKFYGKGKMLHPSQDEIEELVKQVPKGRVATISEIANRLAINHGVDVTCPMRTGNALKKVAERYSRENLDVYIPFWRVIRKDLFVVKSKNYEFSASLLEDEGFELSYTKSGLIKINVEEKALFSFDKS